VDVIYRVCGMEWSGVTFACAQREENREECEGINEVDKRNGAKRKIQSMLSCYINCLKMWVGSTLSPSLIFNKYGSLQFSFSNFSFF